MVIVSAMAVSVFFTLQTEKKIDSYRAELQQIDDVTAEHPVDTDRVYLVGCSMGGKVLGISPTSIPSVSLP